MPRDDIALKPKQIVKPKLEKPKLYKVILFNDDYTPREFVVLVLKVVFRMGADISQRVMMTAHKLGSSVVVVCTKDIAETKVKEAMDLAKDAGFPLMFKAEPEE
ncbi:ATP-dependent Clp protease adapter ClpS [Oryzifoliimicrobium ureilyticus]|uniref:ATP-dependent Clp protease adapter ClpS n=1 Tax=Oryzifoliimicrobium ureilyticus TaxID=3113724 RepID=UPI0030764433